MRQFFVAILIIALPLGWFSNEHGYPAFKRRATIKRLKADKVRLAYGEGSQVLESTVDGWDYSTMQPQSVGPSWLSPITGDEWFQESPTSISFEIAQFAPTDRDALDLSQFESLEHLDFHNALNSWTPDLTDKGIGHLTALKQLQRLNLGGTKVSDDGIAQLAKIETLEEINLSQSQVTDASVSLLASMPNLKAVSIYRTQISASAIEKLVRLKPGLLIDAEQRRLPSQLRRRARK